MGIRMIDRYTLPRMKTIWATEHKLETWLRIERLVCSTGGDSEECSSRHQEESQDRCPADGGDRSGCQT